jgi:carbon-monoxide dehydrogenase medium subunit
VKAAPFDYARPTELDSALELLHRPGAKALAGGQSLLAMMAMRLARPRLLVDLGAVDGLAGIASRNGTMAVGAMTPQRDLEQDADAAAALPLVAAALPHVGHREIRNRGTIGGSIAHADPSAELPLVAAVLRATLVAHGPGGERELPADDFATGPFTTRLADDELLVRIELPRARAGDGYAFDEVARRHGDYALCGVACHVRVEDGRVAGARVGVLGTGPTPVVRDLDGAPAADAAEALAAELEPADDMHASASYRRRLARVLVARCLERARDDAEARQ